ncbi:histone deacetylase family protein [Cesiribacter andamanensis]|uniref:Acetoin utilization protein AcuC n=1 Tax=Cesiribacter andamanensis AMV16 TaxID=1279009 RepID=M7N160_9BACT|nr:histone deacetylase [Cesiribacter andamanensis]EMR00951.1 Acetoin utilization protein AcuC [Cesiribacter andamanensis AMV16]
MLKIAWAPCYAHPLPAGHRFPMIKYELLPEQLLYEGTCSADNFFEPEPLPEADLLLTHDPLYWQKLNLLQLSRSEERKTGFPLSHELVRREVTIMNGTVQAALYALQWGIGMNVAGGTHHAFTDRGEGFCLLNDNAIAANYLLDRGLAQKILIVDLDVHQGNGTAQIFRHEPRVFTFSMHGEKNYPLHKEQSDLDIGLPDGTGDARYLELLAQQLPRLLEEVAPDVVFYQCGVDVLASDTLGRLKLSLQGCRERDALVLRSCHAHKLPLVCSMGGGYSSKLFHIVEAHANTFRLAQEIFF